MERDKSWFRKEKKRKEKKVKEKEKEKGINIVRTFAISPEKQRVYKLPINYLDHLQFKYRVPHPHLIFILNISSGYKPKRGEFYVLSLFFYSISSSLFFHGLMSCLRICLSVSLSDCQILGVCPQ